MGNSCSSCCGMGGLQCCCFGSRKGKSGKMAASDLHSSGAQENVQKKAVVQSRPTSLPTRGGSNMPSTSSAQTRGGGSGPGKFSEFSLHGVQKTSPVEQSDDNSGVAQESQIEHKFLVENVTGLFNVYKESDCDEILEDGIAKFCNDLKVDPAEFIVLALAWKFKAATMCRFTREEFMSGCVALQADSIKSLQDSFPTLEKDAMTNFKDIYKYAFQFGLDSEQGQRSLPSEVAIGMWQVVFTKSPPVLLDDWLKFLEDSKIRGISRDTWNMFLHFTENVGADLNNYDDNEAWPSLFDDFVEYYRNRKVEIEEKQTEVESLSQSNLSPTEETEHDEPILTEITLPGLVPLQSSDEETSSNKELMFEKANENANSVKVFENSENDPTRTNLLIEKDSDDASSAASDVIVNDIPTTSDEQNIDFDSEPIRCDTLHSSHTT